MRYTKLKISEAATGKLRAARQRTGITPNLLCRAAIMLSLEEGPISALAPDDLGQEFNAYTLTGEFTGLFGDLIRFVELEGGNDPNDSDLPRLMQAHIHRGVGALSVRVKSAADCARLAADLA